MGERFQFYIISKDRNEKKHITAIHDQWCWGGTAVKYTDHLIRTLQSADWQNMYNDTDDFVKSILSLRWYYPNDSKQKMYFYHRVHIEDMGYSPDLADSNHGCVIIDIMDLHKAKASFFSSNGSFIPVAKVNADEKKIEDDELLKNVYDTLSETDYQNLCQYMKDLYKLSQL